MRLLIPLLVAVGVAVSSNIDLDESVTANDPQAVSVAYHQILAISMAVCKEDMNRLIDLVMRARSNSKHAAAIMKNWPSVQIEVQWAYFDGDKEIIMSGAFDFNNKTYTGRFDFEKRPNRWDLADLPPILYSTPTRQKEHIATGNN